MTQQGRNRRNPFPQAEDRLRGRCQIGSLANGQEFRTLATERLGYIIGRDRRHSQEAVRVILNPETLDEQNVHPCVIVEAL